MRFLIALSFLFLSFTQLGFIEGMVISVKDGDSIEIYDSTNGQTVEVQLYGIDCPELGQSYGEKAKEYTSSLCYHENVVVEVLSKDAIGKTLGRVIVNGYDVSEELVKAGYAWHFTKYTTNARLDSLQDYAISQSLGLWKGDTPMAPWVFREKTASTATTHTVKKKQIVTNTVLICNSSGAYAYHSYQCWGLLRCRKEIYSLSENEARGMGRVPCKVCY